MNQVRRFSVLTLVLLVLTGCAAQRVDAGSAKPEFVAEADRICDTHLGVMLAWLGRPAAGDPWRRLAVENDGIYRIMGRTIGRLKALGPAPGPDASAFDDYLRTLTERARAFKLKSTAYSHGNRLSAGRLQRLIDGFKSAGDRDAHRYGLQICGTGPDDAARAFAPPEPMPGPIE